ncbi:HAMP domain-containing sensor histidine kinase [Acrocarpospora sp. B8E8]|uniref:sensor histidine kinase n=1 Tax=Acrocarpospora sp. B8E8 TaxID=3153572 RepID=UPI00325DF05C
MTVERPAGLGPLGWRLLAAFLLVALSSVVLLSLAALVGTDRGITAAREADRAEAARATAAAAGAAYTSAGGWVSADLGPARAIAAGADARLFVLDRNEQVVLSPGGAFPQDGMTGPGMHSGVGATMAAVIVDGVTVGWAQLRFGTPTTQAARSVAWGWIAAAALAALAVASAASLLVTRRLTRPLSGVTRAAHAFAAGDRAARTGVTGPGELGELGRAFDEMAGRVAQAERSRRHLAADVAHELRTPLSALQAGLEELRDGLSAPDPDRLAALHDQTLRLGRIVGDLAELSAAESAALSLHRCEVDLAELAATVLRSREPRLRAAGLDMRADLAEGVTVQADPDRLHQAVGNLLDNAARYCRPGDTVMVTVGAAGGQATVEVADTGPGVPAEDLPHIFDRLWRGPASTGIAGSGIGLAVVRELITAHHGTVTATPRAAGGLAFAIHLPSSTPPAGRRNAL